VLVVTPLDTVTEHRAFVLTVAVCAVKVSEAVAVPELAAATVNVVDIEGVQDTEGVASVPMVKSGRTTAI
jgi:hypothetical protein